MDIETNDNSNSEIDYEESENDSEIEYYESISDIPDFCWSSKCPICKSNKNKLLYKTNIKYVYFDLDYGCTNYNITDLDDNVYEELKKHVIINEFHYKISGIVCKYQFQCDHNDEKSIINAEKILIEYGYTMLPDRIEERK
jgi:hypothetical protein